MRRLIAITLLILLPILIGCRIQIPRPQVEEFEIGGPPLRYHAHSLCLGDFHVRGETEIAYLSTDRRYLCIAEVAQDSTRVSVPFPLLHRIPLEAGTSYHLISRGDCDADGIDELLLSLTRGNSLVIQVYNSNYDTPLFETEPIHLTDTNGDRSVHSDASICVLENFSHDHRRVIVAAVMTGYDIQPRGIFVYDAADGSALWHYDLAGLTLLPDPETCRDVNGDGATDLLVLSAAINNNHLANGMSDTLGYLVALSGADEDTLWTHQLGRGYSFASQALTDLDGDGILDVLAAYSTGSNWQHQSILDLLDAQRGNVRSSYKREGSDWSSPIRLSGIAPKQTFSMPTSDGSLIAFQIENDSLVYRECHDATPPSVGSLHRLQLWGDATPELVFQARPSIIALDESGHRVVAYRSPDIRKEVPRILGSVTLGNRSGILCASSKAPGINDLQLLLTPLQNHTSVRHRAEALFPAILIGIGLAGLLSVSIIRPIKRVHQDSHLSRAGWANLARSLEVLYQVDDSPSASKKWHESITAADSIASSLGADAKGARTLINQLGPPPSPPDQSPKQSTTQSITLKLRRLIATHIGSDPVQCVKQALHGRSGRLSEIEAGVSSIHIDGTLDGLTYIPANDLRWIIEELIDNALHAKDESRSLLLSISLRREDGFFTVDIQDTGKGIEASHWEKIFDLGVSSRASQGHGYGLHRVAKLLGEWGGSARVAKSVVGGGTTMQCRLPYISGQRSSG